MKARSLGKDGFVGEIVGFDCTKKSPAQMARVKELLFENRVLVVRDQWLSPQSYQEFMEGLGLTVCHVLQNFTVEGYPSILKISDYVAPDGTLLGVLDGGTYWHSDMSYLPDLGFATSLYAVRSSARSGGTSFVDLSTAWDLLRQNQDILAIFGCASATDALTLNVVHRFGNRQTRLDRGAARQELSQEQQSRVPGTVHRLLERHPATGRIGLFAPSGSAMEIEGLSEEQSVQALDQLEDAILGNCDVYTHHYDPGDLVIWDNMTTLHRGTGVHPTENLEECRLLHRINVNYAAVTL
ncbi:TauD/TfdA family dioxygenase [Streptomyces sp. NPDC005336]|uniref:TauD/TfdA dioxygenase family protein n=1 Tax=Streptomyces sp. NPDC005336 TaxID=3157035 RepID=UPI0033BA629F